MKFTNITIASDFKVDRRRRKDGSMGTAKYTRYGSRGIAVWSERRLMHIDEARRKNLI